MGWTEDMYAGAYKSGARATTKDLVNAYNATGLGPKDRIDVIASASRTEPRLNDSDGRKGYMLWIYGVPSWGQEKKAVVFTVLMSVNWESGAVMYKDFGLDAAECNIPPAKFVKALPESLGNAWEDKQLAEVRAYYKALEAKKELIAPGAKVDLGEGLRLSNGMEVRWFEVYRRETANGRRGPLCLFVPKVGPVRGLGRDWVKRVQQVIPAGATEAVAV